MIRFKPLHDKVRSRLKHKSALKMQVVLSVTSNTFIYRVTNITSNINNYITSVII